MSEVFWIPIVLSTGSFVMIVAIVFLATRSRQRKAEMRAEVQMKLIDKFGTASEFVQFLQSPAGQQFLDQPRHRSRERAVGGITGALICSFLGLAFLMCAFFFGDNGFLVPAFILLGIGIALFLSFFISWKLLKQTQASEPPSLS